MLTTRAYRDLPVGLCWGTLQNASLPDLIEVAARQGFSTLSIRPNQVAAALEQGSSHASLRKHLRDGGVKVRVIDAISALPGMPDVVDGLAGLGGAPVTAEACLRVAEIVEAPIVNVAHFGGTPVPLAEMAEAVGGMCRLAARQEVSLVLEFVPATGIGNLAQACEIVELAGEPNCGVLFDTWHFARTGGTTEEIRSLPKQIIGAFQIADRVPLPPGAPYVPMTGRLLPGEGELPLKEWTNAVMANNPGLTAELEVFSEELRNLSLAEAGNRIARAIQAWRNV